MSKLPRIGILCSGGPAPGFNGVISSVTFEGIENGFEVIGFIQGFKYLQTGEVSPDQYKILTPENVSRIIFQGGSIIMTSRANPKRFDDENPELGFSNCIKALKSLNCLRLVTIGGDDTCSSATRLHNLSQGEIKIAHVPKTIDNDLPLPGGACTFGFSTAVDLGAHLVMNLMTDAQTYERFFLVVAMGRKAGHLALGIGKGASAPLILIPEEFIDEDHPHVSFSLVCDVIIGCIIKRKMCGQNHGVIVLAEGLIENMHPDEARAMFGDALQLDSFGNVNLGVLDFGAQLKKAVASKLQERNLSVSLTTKKLGYELRCEPPNAFDRSYTRALGFSACRQLINDDLPGGRLVCIVEGKAFMIPFEEVPADENGHTIIRQVDCTAESFLVSRAYQVRLKTKDFTDAARIDALVRAGRFESVEAYMEYFAAVAQMESQY